MKGHPQAEAVMVQLLDEEGELSESASLQSDPDAEFLRTAYQHMSTIRRVDEVATALQRQGELGIWEPIRGQEAAQIGSALTLQPDDFAFGTYREHGVAWCRGVRPDQIIRHARGTDLGGWDPTEHNFALYSIVIGSHTLHATGYAMGVQRDNAAAAVIAYFGDGATSQGDVSEAMNFAAVYNAPVVFFCQNNQWAISSPLSRQTRVELHERPGGFGIPSTLVDGNDVLAVRVATTAALSKARAGGGPSFIEARTYRMGPHTTSDDPTRYRTEGEVEAWRHRDPIVRVRRLLENRQWADGSWFDSVAKEANDVAEELRARCIAMPNPEPLSMFDDVYASPTPPLEAQRKLLSKHLDSLE